MALERGDQPLPAGTEGLPRAFLQSLRTLFDILDDRRRGYVHLREIESRWRGAEARELPSGVMEGLRRAAPASGYLTFERFVLGLRAALPGADPPAESGGRRSGEKPLSPRCAEERPVCFLQMTKVCCQPGTQAPGLVLCSIAPCHVCKTMLQIAAGGLMLSFVTGGDAKAAGQSQGDSGHPGAGDARRHQRGRAEHRRHTITNGVDFSMLKHMKELEQEKDFLLQGLELVECAWEWYHQHIQFMQERQRLLGKNKTSVVSMGLVLEAPTCLGGFGAALSHPFPSSFLQPANPSSALSRLVPVVSPASAGSQQAINMLKEQNRLLTKVRGEKGKEIPWRGARRGGGNEMG
uniref:Suppressor APC domain-containing protein n=1 Tax=Melopsittacus undulatus TaxID=13146 RepID=A0A8C6NC42_MELUD